ncbi:MAG: hypothetical protein LBB22_03465, partial [Treponema sp.]|nr:hypothetical protein [Treponema sp.]
MKIQRLPSFFLILINFFVSLSLLTGASSFWEGSSSTDLYGTLPERGFYVATSFFPRNTVVNITNLETGKTIQAIVSDNSSSPGSTVILSRDAAEALGMGSRSSIRIRMNPPSDSVAFSRFADGRSFSGDPDYDPKAFIRANTLPVETQAQSAPPQRASEPYPYEPYSGSPPPIRIIPDPMPVQEPKTTPPAKVELSQAEVPSAVYPLLSPPEPITFFMPSPVPTAVIVNDDSVPAAEAEPGNTVTPSAFEIPEVSDAPYAMPYNDRDGILPAPETPRYVTVPKLEPENPFPDVSSPYTNPIDYSNSGRIALDEAHIEKIYEIAGITKPSTPLDSKDTAKESVIDYTQPDVVSPGTLPQEKDIAKLTEVTGSIPESKNTRGEEITNTSDTSVEVLYPTGFPAETAIGRLDDAVFNENDVTTPQPDIPGVTGEIVFTPEDGAPVEVLYPNGSFDDSEIVDLYDAIFRESSSPVIAETGEEFIFDTDRDLLSDILAEASLAYAEPGMTGTIDLIDGRWIIKDNVTGEEHIIGDILENEATTAEVLYPSEYPDEVGAGSDLYDAIFREAWPEATLAYAEPGMTGTIDLIDGRWIIKDNVTGEEHIIGDILENGAITAEVLYPSEYPDETEAGGDLYDAIFREAGPETPLAYAEPGMRGTIDLIDGRWIIKDNVTGEERVIGDILENGVTMAEALYPSEYPDEIGAGDLYDAIFREAGPETPLAYAEPGMQGVVDLVDGRWTLKNDDGYEYIFGVPMAEASYPSGYPDEAGTGNLYDALFREAGPETPLAYAEPGMRGVVDLVDGRWTLKNDDGYEYIFGVPMAEASYPSGYPDEAGT